MVGNQIDIGQATTYPNTLDQFQESLSLVAEAKN